MKKVLGTHLFRVGLLGLIWIRKLLAVHNAAQNLNNLPFKNLKKQTKVDLYVLVFKFSGLTVRSLGLQIG